MIGDAKLIHVVQADDLRSILDDHTVDEDVVVQRAGFIRVDVIVARTGHLGEHARRGQRVVDVAPLPVENVGVS